MTDPAWTTSRPIHAAVDRLLAPRVLRRLWFLCVLLSPLLWFAVSPCAITRTVHLTLAPDGPLGAAWAVEWTRRATGERNGVWIEPAAGTLVGDQPLELRPSGVPADPAQQKFGFHIYEVTSASWTLRRADLKRALADFNADPASARARGWEFRGPWVPGVETSGIIYTGTTPGLLRIPVPARAAAEGLTVFSEKVPVGGAVTMSFRGRDTTFDCSAPRWEALLLRPEPGPSPDTPWTIDQPLPSYTLAAVSLAWHDSPGGALNVPLAHVRTRVFGRLIGDSPLPQPRVAGGTLAAGTHPAIRDMQAVGEITWPAVPAVPYTVHALGTGAVLIALVLAWGVVLAVAAVPWAGLLAPFSGWIARRSPARALARSLPCGVFTPFRVVLAVTIAAHAWFASWAPLLYLPDCVEYVYNAHRLFDTGRFDHFSAWRMPGTSFMLLPWIALSSRPEDLAGWVQALDGVLVACMAYDILRRFVPRGWAGLGMLLAGLDPVGLLWERHLITETPTALLLTAAAWMLVRLDGAARDRRLGPALAWAVGVGLAAALATYVRGNALLLVLLAPPMVIVALWSPGRRGRALLLAGAIAATSVAAMAPWMLRNQRVYGQPAMIIGRGFARLIFAWYGQQIDVNQTRLFDRDAWKDAAARQASGANEFDFMLQLDASPRLAGPPGTHPWVQRDTRCAIANDESRARRPADAALLAAKALLSHLHLWQDPSQRSFRNTDFYSQPHRGRLYGSSPFNWARAPADTTFGEQDRIRDLADRTLRDIRWVVDDPNAAAFRAWYAAFDAVRPVLGALSILGGLLALREPRRILWIVPLLWFGNALAFSWVFLNGETRYSEPLYALAIIAAVFGLCRACQGLRHHLAPRAPARE